MEYCEAVAAHRWAALAFWTLILLAITLSPSDDLHQAPADDREARADHGHRARRSVRGAGRVRHVLGSQLAVRRRHGAGAGALLGDHKELQDRRDQAAALDREWDVLGLGGKYESIEHAKAKAERIYRGVTARWVETGITAEEARRLWDETWADEHCSFCNKIPPDVDMMIEGKGVRICDACIAEFNKMVQEQRASKV